jgi:hypothetical protein
VRKPLSHRTDPQPAHLWLLPDQHDNVRASWSEQRLLLGHVFTGVGCHQYLRRA